MPPPKGSMKFSETCHTQQVGSALIYGTDACQLTLEEAERGGEELNKKRGVSSQKVAYLCSNSLTPSVVQRSGLLMGREQIGGCHLWLFQMGRAHPLYSSGAGLLQGRQSPGAPGSDIDLLRDVPPPP